MNYSLRKRNIIRKCNICARKALWDFPPIIRDQQIDTIRKEFNVVQKPCSEIQLNESGDELGSSIILMLPEKIQRNFLPEDIQ